MNSLGSRLLQWITNESITTAISSLPGLAAAAGSPGGSYPDPEASTLCPMPASNCSSEGGWCHLDCSGLGEQCRWMEKGNQTGRCRWIAGAGHHHQPLGFTTSCLDSTGPRCSFSHILPLVPGYPSTAAIESLPIQWYYQSETHLLSPITAASSSALALWSIPENASVP